MKLVLGVILMVLGMIGIARGSVGSAPQPNVPSHTAGEDSHSLPFEPLASSMLLVGGLIILATNVRLRVEHLKFRSGDTAGMLQRERIEEPSNGKRDDTDTQVSSAA